MHYEGYIRKRSKHMRTESYLYLSIQLSKFVMSNDCGLLRTYKKSTQKIPNSHVCSTNGIKSNRINADRSKSKSFHVDVCSTEEIESKSVHKMNINSHVCYTAESK